MSKTITLTVLVSLLLVSPCVAQEGEGQPQGCLGRMRVRLNNCLPEMRLIKKALPVAVLVHAADAGLGFAMFPHDALKLTVVPFALSLPAEIVMYQILKGNDARHTYKKALYVASGGLATWIGSAIGTFKEWPAGLTSWYSLLWGVGGMGVASYYSFCSQTHEVQQNVPVVEGNQGDGNA